MFAFQSMSYTSLKDILPASPSPAAYPTNCSSLKEIPLKDPLLQHAARAYLHPVAGSRDADKRWRRRLQEKFSVMLGCFNDVVLVMFTGLFAEQGSDGDDDRVD
ncbi:hypothetical protein OROGR_007789 [Orobanche gracilis]